MGLSKKSLAKSEDPEDDVAEKKPANVKIGKRRAKKASTRPKEKKSKFVKDVDESDDKTSISGRNGNDEEDSQFVHTGNERESG